MAGQNSKNIYEGIGDDEIVRRVRMDLGLSGIAPEDAPTLHSLESSYPGRKLNVVILLQESLGADYVGVLTGGNLTPNVDAVYREGWGFYSLYATGTRSVRGIEAVTTGFTPTYNSAVVKLPCGESDFFSIASVLKDRGYDTSFIYGGESHFDNMKSFFLRNGYSRIIDQDSYENPHSPPPGACRTRISITVPMWSSRGLRARGRISTRWCSPPATMTPSRSPRGRPSRSRARSSRGRMR